MFNLIPTEPLEYQVYADWLEDQGVILTAAIREGVLPFVPMWSHGEGIESRTTRSRPIDYVYTVENLFSRQSIEVTGWARGCRSGSCGLQNGYGSGDGECSWLEDHPDAIRSDGQGDGSWSQINKTTTFIAGGGS